MGDSLDWGLLNCLVLNRGKVDHPGVALGASDPLEAHLPELLAQQGRLVGAHAKEPFALQEAFPGLDDLFQRNSSSLFGSLKRSEECFILPEENVHVVILQSVATFLHPPDVDVVDVLVGVVVGGILHD